MDNDKFESVNKIPTGERMEVRLGLGRSNLGSWWMDGEGTIGHNCLHQLDGGTNPAWFSRVANGYDPVGGCFRAYCMTCGTDAPEEVFQFASLKRFGKIYKKAMERKE